MRRYGFHGLSYEYIAGRLREVAPALPRQRHRGASGQRRQRLRHERRQSIDTTMGFSALDGLLMGTRCGGSIPA